MAATTAGSARATRSTPMPHEPTPVAAFGASIPQRPELIVDIDEAKEIIADPEGAALVSVRTWREHVGAVSGYNYIGPAGPDQSATSGATAARTRTTCSTTGRSRTRCGLIRRSPRTGPRPGSRRTSGSRSTAARAGGRARPGSTRRSMGLPRAAVYDGGWFEWSLDPVNNPIEIGDPSSPTEDETAA